MAHQSLYRTYRPQTFADVVGQTHITRTLRNAVTEGTVAHAYLFTGPRGTGKTTTARILAKALECEQGPTPEPDGTCQECVDIAEGRHPDVYELDAASRTQVENVREEIIGRLAYAPTRGRSKVYIIDEVHMLSTSSFNALLKSIEEPPPHVVFILCTTHPHKVPETIHSRCQRFDFRRISVEDIAERLQLIADAEGIGVAEGSLALVAKHAAGGMRDAITTLEQLAAFTGNAITFEDVEGLLGEVDRALLFEATDIIASRDIPEGFRFVARLAESGADVSEFVRELSGHMRDVYVVSAVGDAAGIVDTTTDDLARLTSQASLFGPARLARVLDVLGELGSELRWSSDPRLAIEVALTRLARPQGELSVPALAERVEALELAVQSIGSESPAHGDATAATAPGHAPSQEEGAVASGPPSAPPSAVRPEPGAKTVGDLAPGPESSDAAVEASETAEATEAPGAPTLSESPPVSAQAEPLDQARVKRAWSSVVAEIKKHRPARASTFVSSDVDIDTDGVTLVIEFPRDEPFRLKIADEPDTRDAVKRALGVVLGATPPFRYQLGRGAVQPPEPDEPETDDVPVDGRVPAGQAEMPEDADHATPTDSDRGVVGEEAPQESAGAEGLSDSTASTARATADAPDEIERLLAEELGARVVGEQVHDTPEWEVEQ